MASYRGKYAPLFRHLSALDRQQWPATFEEVEAILRFPLPPSAHTHSAWWANEDSSHSHARAWQRAGWRTSAVDLAAGTLVFTREAGASSAARRGAGAPQASFPRKAKRASGKRGADLAADDTGLLTLGGEEFRHAADISPDAGPDGKPLEDMPQRRYHAAATTPLNPHGRGPFCRFSVAGLPAASGVYAVTVAQRLAYVGIAKSLRERWGPRGYAKIHPRNCFQGGQSTNCKVNHAILRATRRGQAVRLWIHQTATPRPLEKRLIAKLEPPWNA